MTKEFNSLEEIQKYYDEKSNTYIFKENGAYISLMAQYTPFGNADKYPELQRHITKGEYDRVYEKLLSLGITEYYAQELGSASESFIPQWDF